MSPGSLISLKRIHVMREANVGLAGLDLDIDLGEHTAILGPNGSGKSTLIATLFQELHPLARHEPRVRVLGRDRWHVYDLRKQIGIVSPDWLRRCTKDVPAREIVLTGFFSASELWPYLEVTEAMREAAARMIDRLELSTIADRNMDELSSGERRRVMLARALVHRPKALLLDEPTASLDLRALHEFREALQLAAGFGATILLVTHHLGDIVPDINRVVLLRSGRVFDDGPKMDMLSSEKLSALYDLDLKVMEHRGYYGLV